MHVQLCIDFCYKSNFSLAALTGIGYKQICSYLLNTYSMTWFEEVSATVQMTQVSPLLMILSVATTVLVTQQPPVEVKRIQPDIIQSMAQEGET